MTKDEALQKINQGDGDFHVFTEIEHKAFLNNVKDTDIFKQQIDVRIGDLEKRYSSDVTSITKNQPKGGERAYDFMKRELSTLVTSAEDLKSKNEGLQKVIDDNTGGEAYEQLKSEHATVKRKHVEKMGEWEQKYNNLEQSGEQMRMTHEFDQSILGLKFKDVSTVPEEIRNVVIDNAKSELLKEAKFIQGKLVFMVDGEVMLDDMMKPITAKDRLTEKLKLIIDPGRTQTGVDVNKPEEKKDKDGNLEINLSIPDSVKTNVDLGDHLLSLGYVRGSEKFTVAYAKYRDKVKVI